jgi:hypothetical protein
LTRAVEAVSETPAAVALISEAKAAGDFISDTAHEAGEMGWQTARGFQRVGQAVIRAGSGAVEGAESAAKFMKYWPLAAGAALVFIIYSQSSAVTSVVKSYRR